jgi:hypothetical protein
MTTPVRHRVPAVQRELNELARQHEQALDSLAREAELRQALEDRLAARRDLLQQCRSWVPPAIQARIDKELAT